MKTLDPAHDANIILFMKLPIINYSLLNEQTAGLAKELLQTHEAASKPMDGIHLTTAILRNVDEMHTFDGADLLLLDGRIRRADGEPLKISVPTPLPAPEPEPGPPEPDPQTDMFEDANAAEGDDDGEAAEGVEPSGEVPPEGKGTGSEPVGNGVQHAGEDDSADENGDAPEREPKPSSEASEGEARSGEG